MKNYIELSNANKVTGRRKIKAVIHEIYDSNDQYNKNGISWNEQYTKNNLDTVRGMAICVEFIDPEKSEPLGHGITGVKDGKPIFEDSVMVGVFEEGSIETIKVKGRKIKALVGTGYINEQRYPLFVRWLVSEMNSERTPEGSVEICAKEGYESIVYDGGYKEKGRVPQIYDYTGYCILGVEPADDSAVVLELNNKKQQKEEVGMSEELIKNLNEKLESKIKEINMLKNQIKDGDKKIKELNEKIAKTEKTLNEKTQEVNSLNETIKKKDEKITTLTKELNELKNEKLKNELNTKLESYTDKEKEVANKLIETFSEKPSEELLNNIITEINNNIVKQMIDQRTAQKVTAETNSKKAENIYGDLYENNETEITIDDLY